MLHAAAGESKDYIHPNQRAATSWYEAGSPLSELPTNNLHQQHTTIHMSCSGVSVLQQQADFHANRVQNTWASQSTLPQDTSVLAASHTGTTTTPCTSPWTMHITAWLACTS